MMRVRWPPTAQQARLQRHELEVIAVAVAPRFAQGQASFVDPSTTRPLDLGVFAVSQRERQASVERQSAGVRFSWSPAFAGLTLSARVLP